MEQGGAAFKLGEERRIGAGHPHLPAERLERLEQAAPAAGVEMGRDLVEKHERRDSGHRRDEPRLGEDEADEKRLLLAGRGGAGSDVLRAMPHREIGGLRADKGAAGGAVAGPALAQDGAVAVLGVDGGVRGDERVDLAL